MKGVKKLTRLANRIRNGRKKTRKRRTKRQREAGQIAGSKSRYVIPADCKVDGEFASKITLMLIEDEPTPGDGPPKKSCTIMLKYDPKCHDVISLSSECSNINSVNDTLTNLVDVAKKSWH